MPLKKSNLNNACSRDARRIRRKRAERALMLTNQTTVANTAERQGATERRTQEISKHCDKRLWLQGEIESKPQPSKTFFATAMRWTVYKVYTHVYSGPIKIMHLTYLHVVKFNKKNAWTGQFYVLLRSESL